MKFKEFDEIEWDNIISFTIGCILIAGWFIGIGYHRFPMWSSTLAVITGLAWLSYVLASIIEGDPF